MDWNKLGGTVLKTGNDIGVSLLNDELSKGKNAVPETKPDTRTQPIASTQKFETKKSFSMKDIPKPVIIGGGAALFLGVAFMIYKRGN